MSLLDIALDDGRFGCAVMLTTSLHSSILSQWFESIVNDVFSLHRLHIRKEVLEDAEINKWYVIRFEVIFVQNKEIFCAQDAYKRYFSKSWIDSWLPETDICLPNSIRKCGSAQKKGARASVKELHLLLKLNELTLQQKANHDACKSEYLQRKNTSFPVDFRFLQELTKKYGIYGGRWICTGKSWEVTEAIVACLFKDFLTGLLSREKCILNIVMRHYEPNNPYSTTVSVANEHCTFKSINDDIGLCVKDDEEVSRILNLLRRVLRGLRLSGMKYKAAVYSVCHLSRATINIPSTMYFADLRPRCKRNECGCLHWEHVKKKKGTPNRSDARTANVVRRSDHLDGKEKPEWKRGK